MKKITLILLTIALSSYLFGQRYCGSHLNLTEIRQTDLARYMRITETEYQLQKMLIQKSGNTPTSTITIPVVVHVVYKNSNQNISDAQINAQIQVLNEDFRRLNIDRTNTPNAFASIAGDANIKFVLAKVDPNGNATSGIIRTPTTISGFSHSTDNVKYTSTGGHDAWNTKRYLNIWVCNFSDQGLMGYAQFPFDLESRPKTDGVVISYKYFGVGGHTTYPYNKGRTTTHEVGHWLGLRHIWGDANNCTATDHVDDTPSQYTATYNCPSFPKTDACTRSNPGIMFMNYMDYTNDGCMNIFTNGQIARMRTLFDAQTGIRREIVQCSELLSDNTLAISGPDEINGPTEYVLNNVPKGSTVKWNYGPYIHPTSGHPLIQPFVAGGIGTTPRPMDTSFLREPELTNFVTYTYDEFCILSSIGATISYNGCSVSVSKNVYVGPVPNKELIGSLYNYHQISGSLNCEYTDVITFNGNPNGSGITQGEWQKPGSYGPVRMSASPLSPFDNYEVMGSILTFNGVKFNSNNEGYMEARLANNCGWSGWKQIVYYKGGLCPTGSGGIIRVSYSPNPTTDELTVTFEELPTMPSDDDLSTNNLSSTQNLSGQSATTGNQTETYSVKLLDVSGVVLRQAQFNHSNGSGKPQPVKFNISSLRKGTYFLHVEGGGELIREQIMVN